MAERRFTANELVGAAEIAERLGVGTSVVHDWRRRHRTFPVPIAALTMGNIWVWSEVEAWAIESGRLKIND